MTTIDRKPIGDDRGFLCRLYSDNEISRFGFSKGIAQINHTMTVKCGTVRGMHFQHPPHAEVKLVLCIRGSVYDVAVDLRAGSPTFLRWHGEILSADNNRALLIPEGFAHGFQSLEDNVELIYLHSAAYEPAAEGGVHHADPRINIDWPLPVADLSARDNSHDMIGDDFEGILL